MLTVLLLVDSRSSAGTPAGDGGSVGKCQTTESRTQATDDHHRQLYTTRVPGNTCSYVHFYDTVDS